MIQPLHTRIAGTTNKGTAVYLNLPPLQPGQIARITHLALHNQSGESVTAEFGVTVNGTWVQIWPEETITNGDAYATMLDFRAGYGEIVNAKVTGSADQGSVTLTASGDIITPETVIVEVPGPVQ